MKISQQIQTIRHEQEDTIVIQELLAQYLKALLKVELDVIKENIDQRVHQLKHHAQQANIAKGLDYLKQLEIEKLDIIVQVVLLNKIQLQVVELFDQADIIVQEEVHHQLLDQLEHIEILKEDQYYQIDMHDRMDTIVKLQDLPHLEQDHEQQAIIVQRGKLLLIQQPTYAQQDQLVLQVL